jgi:hypothetical protein
LECLHFFSTEPKAIIFTFSVSTITT